MSLDQKIVQKMKSWSRAFTYRQQIGVWSSTINNYLRPDPEVVGYADCTSVIQRVYLWAGVNDPGYYTQDMLGRGKRVNSSANPDWNNFKPGDIVIMQWYNGVYHAEMVINKHTLIGHPGPGRGPYEKDLRSYLGGAYRWWVQRHDLSDPTPKPEPEPEPEEEEHIVEHKAFDDPRARAGGIVLDKGKHFYLSQSETGTSGTARNMAFGGPGAYVTAQHVYVSGTPGDAVDAALIIRKNKTSPVQHVIHWQDRIVLDKNGVGRATITWARDHAKDTFQLLRVKAPTTNKGPVKVTRHAANVIKVS